MKPAQHAIISAGLGVLLGYWLRSWAAAIACLISGTLMDIDHPLDYYLTRKEIPRRYKDLLAYCSSPHSKMYLFFHSYELLAVLWIVISCLRLDGAWSAAALGISVHMLCDQWTNPLKPPAYFFVYRLHHGFERKNIFQEDFWNKTA